MYQRQIIILSKNQLNQLNERSKKDSNESCAILLGKLEENKHIVSHVYLCTNIDESPVSFQIGFKQQLQIAEYAFEHKLEIVGTYHSHPLNLAYPSAKDFEYMKRHPTVWIIFSRVNDEVRAFVRDGDDIKSAGIKLQ